MTHLLHEYGLYLLFVAIAIESAGVPIPGETTLVTAAVLARPEYHAYSLWSVIVVGAAGAIFGDNVGYTLGRVGGRRLLTHFAFTDRYAEKALPPAERFFERHGGKAVFFGRFIAILRVTAAWLAGISRMPWWEFFLYNAAGGILWSAGISVLAYEAGKAVADGIDRYGLYAVVGLIVLAALAYVGLRTFRRRVVKEG